MHDPMTQAFVIPYGWRNETFNNGTKWRYWKPFITIWHRDPERRASHDSCGWFTPPFTQVQREIVNILAADEARDPWFQSLNAKQNTNPVECESYVRGAFLLVSRCFENRCKAKPVTLEQATRWASLMVHNTTDNFRNRLSFKSGYHSNWYRDTDPNTAEEDRHWREENAKGFFGAIMGYILRERRPWYRHPKWHFWHWELQVHFLQSFKRWAFSRCCKCGKRFAYGESPCSGSWNGTGPLWFRSEQYVYHMACDDSRKVAQELSTSGQVGTE